MSNQEHKAIFITGSSSGLGRATAKLFASKGWKVIASMRDPKKEEELIKISGITLMALDITNLREIERVAEQVVASGGVDVVFNNAGYGLAGALEGLTDDTNSPHGEHQHVGSDPHNKGVYPTFQREKSRIVHQYDLDWWFDDSSFQFHLSCDEMGA